MSAYIFVVMQNLVKIRLSADKLLRIFDFPNGVRPPSWILVWRYSRSPTTYVWWS